MPHLIEQNECLEILAFLPSKVLILAERRFVLELPAIIERKTDV